MEKNTTVSQHAPQPASAGDGPLTGVNVAIWPNLSVRGWPAGAGSVALEGFVALEDAAAVEGLRAAGASIAGSVGMSELGLGLVGDEAASALADGRCDAVLVTDTMGEARCAAAAAGAVGFKPSHGIVSRFGLIGLVPSMECLAVAAGSVKLASAVMGACSGPDERDFSMLAEGIPDFTEVGAETGGAVSVGLIREALAGLTREEADALRAGLSQVEKTGANVREVSMPEFELFRTVHNVVGSAEASSAAGKYDSVRYGHRAGQGENWNEMYLNSRSESFGTLVKSYLFQGAHFQFNDFEAFQNACRIRGRLVRQTQGLLGEVDLLVLPTRRLGLDAAAAGTVLQVYDAFAMTLPANVAGLPAVSLPGLVMCGETDLGLQIVGPHLGDVRVLSLAARLAGSAGGGR